MERRVWVLILIAALCYVYLIVSGIKRVYTAPLLPVKRKVVVTYPQDKIEIAHKEIFGKLERPKIIFNHQAHIKKLIKLEKKKYWETCAECHKVKKEGDKQVIVFDFPKNPENNSPKAIMNAYHKECISCHKKYLKLGQKKCPITCGKCHIEKNNKYVIKYPSVEFDYKDHDDHVKALKKEVKEAKNTCKLCHYTYDLKTARLYYKNGTEESCYYCHDFSKDRKVGPELAKILKITKKKGLDVKKISHIQCLNCHIKENEKIARSGNKTAKKPPLECVKCHTGKYRNVASLLNVPRPDRGQKKMYFILVKGAQMKGVPFDHAEHERYYKSCRVCHHERLMACDKCHTLSGSAKGGYVSLAEAYHAVFSEHSCVGCHRERILTHKNCVGCHKFMENVDISAKSPRTEICDRCHTGQKKIVMPPKISADKLDPKVVKKDVEIKVIEREFQPAKLPHKKKIDLFVKVTNDSKLARYFHGGKLEVVCSGCHHHTKWGAEVKKWTPPACKNCHPVEFNPAHPEIPRLIAAYHQQCVGCHKAMKVPKAVKKCSDCHKPKKERPSAKAILEKGQGLTEVKQVVENKGE